MVRKILIVAEVSLILILFFYLRGVLKSSGSSDWQELMFGAAILSSCLLFFVLPLTSLVLTHRNPGVFGLTIDNLRRHDCDHTGFCEPGHSFECVVVLSAVFVAAVFQQRPDCQKRLSSS